MYSLQTLTFEIMFMRLHDYLSQKQTSGFIYNKVPYFCAIRNGGFHIYIYIRKNTSSGVNLAGISQIIKKYLFFRQVRFTYIYIYVHTFSSTLPPKHRTEFIIFEHRYVVLGPNLANLECAHMIIKYQMCSWAL